MARSEGSPTTSDARRIADEEIRAWDLEVEIRSIVGRADGVRASYMAGDWARRAYGAERLLFVSLVNSRVERRVEGDRNSILSHVARAAAEWLRRHSLLIPGTLVSIQLSRAVDLRLMSWSWGVGGRAVWVDAAGELTPEPPREDFET